MHTPTFLSLLPSISPFFSFSLRREYENVLIDFKIQECLASLRASAPSDWVEEDNTTAYNIEDYTKRIEELLDPDSCSTNPAAAEAAKNKLSAIVRVKAVTMAGMSKYKQPTVKAVDALLAAFPTDTFLASLFAMLDKWERKVLTKPRLLAYYDKKASSAAAAIAAAAEER
jgi:hypothetical protein